MAKNQSRTVTESDGGQKTWTLFHYTPTGTGVISGEQVLQQTEDAINDLGKVTVESIVKSEQALTASSGAGAQSGDAIAMAQNALATAQAASAEVERLGTEYADTDQKSQEAVSRSQTAKQTADEALRLAQQASAGAGSSQEQAEIAKQAAEKAAQEAAQSAQDAKDAKESAANAESQVNQSAEAAQSANEQAQAATESAKQSEQNANDARDFAQSALEQATAAQESATNAIEEVKKNSRKIWISNQFLTPGQTITQDDLEPQGDGVEAQVPDFVVDKQGRIYALAETKEIGYIPARSTSLIWLNRYLGGGNSTLDYSENKNFGGAFTVDLATWAKAPVSDVKAVGVSINGTEQFLALPELTPSADKENPQTLELDKFSAEFPSELTGGFSYTAENQSAGQNNLSFKLTFSADYEGTDNYIVNAKLNFYGATKEDGVLFSYGLEETAPESLSLPAEGVPPVTQSLYFVPQAFNGNSEATQYDAETTQFAMANVSIDESLAESVATGIAVIGITVNGVEKFLDLTAGEGTGVTGYSDYTEAGQNAIVANLDALATEFPAIRAEAELSPLEADQIFSVQIGLSNYEGTENYTVNVPLKFYGKEATSENHEPIAEFGTLGEGETVPETLTYQQETSQFVLSEYYGELTPFVSYAPTNLTLEQQAQARANIGAAQETGDGAVKAFLPIKGGTLEGNLQISVKDEFNSYKIEFLSSDGKILGEIYAVKDTSSEDQQYANEFEFISRDDEGKRGGWLSLRPIDTLDGDGHGRFILSTGDGDKDVRLMGSDDGTLTWNKKPLGVSATEAVEGTVLLATADEVKAGTDNTRAVTPKALKDAGFITATETANLTRLGLTLIPSVPTVTKTEVTFPAMSRIRLADGTEHVLSVQTLANMEVQASERHGKDVYIWAGLDKVASGDLKLVTSLNAATFSELDKAVCVGGFHGLCANVGTIEGHALSGYVAGDILPRSIWTVNHRPVCAPEGCVWIPEIGKWVQIYLPSWDGTKLVSKFGAVIADGGSEPNFNGSKFAEYAGLAGCELISYDEFTVVAKGSNEGTSIKDAKDPNTTGGHVDTADRRCVSNYGLEDCCGVLWQWTRTLFENVPTAAYTNTELFYLQNYSRQEKPVYNETYDSAKMGSCHGLLRRALVGASWVGSVLCGSRAVSCVDFSAFGWTDDSSRLVSSPKPLPVLGKESNR